MKRRTFLQLCTVTTLVAPVTRAFGQAAASAAGEVHVGKLTVDEFARTNAQGAAALDPVTPTTGSLLPPDELLFRELALGGMMQLQASRAAVNKATAPDVKLLAQAEVDEQTLLAVKMQALAKAKTAQIPAELDAATKAALAKLSAVEAPAFNRAYVREIGVRGHEVLDAVMTRIVHGAQDNDLRALVAAAHPLVQAHLTIARDEAVSML